MRKNLFAYTGPTPATGYPEYLSINEDASGVSVTVRGVGNGSEGPQAEIILPPDVAEKLVGTLRAA